jgi:hypothetical protein
MICSSAMRETYLSSTANGALGPLYHLTERTGRVAFLSAVKALLSPAGILIAA